MKRPPLLSAIAVAGIAAAAVWFLTRESTPTGTAAAPVTSRPTPAARPPAAFMHWLDEVPATPGAESLAAARTRLLALPAEQAVAEIRSFLESGEDRATGLGFEIGGDGNLTGWPTLRVFLLDLLKGIDPAAAARISREVLESPTTADEWALALRNVAKGEDAPGTRDFLRTKTEELIRNPAWQEKPSFGYLNAFDVLVHTRATESAPLLSDIVQRKDRSDLAHAGFLALDRLTQREPVDMLTRLKADSALHASRPEMVAQQFARADLRVEAQRELVKGWLLDPARTELELRTFAETYPNNNQMVSNNLLTTELPVAGGDLARHDREVLALVRGWRSDPGFEKISPYLATMDERLSGFVQEGSEIPAPPPK